jgi:tetratricopeptide (TPR) repeat protein
MTRQDPPHDDRPAGGSPNRPLDRDVPTSAGWTLPPFAEVPPPPADSSAPALGSAATLAPAFDQAFDQAEELDPPALATHRAPDSFGLELGDLDLPPAAVAAPASPDDAAFVSADAASVGSAWWTGQPEVLDGPTRPGSSPGRKFELAHGDWTGGAYILQSKIAEGGQGEIWSAWQENLCREVAVKRLRDSSDLGQFLQEAYTTAALDHPNIVPVHDLGRAGDGAAGPPLLAMKLARGKPWHKLIDADRRAVPFDHDAFLAKHLAILLDVCDAVAYAHSKGIIHRDLKPRQVVVGDYGEVFLMDWGLALAVGGDVPAARPGLPKHRSVADATNFAGTPAYMAPEQAGLSARELGFHTDVYLLGATLYELLTGLPPHMADTATGAFSRAKKNDVDPPGENTPEELRAIAMKALSTAARDRHSSAAEFRDLLRDYLTGAGRRREAAQMVERAAEVLAEAPPDQLTYRQLSLARLRLARALQLSPDNAQAVALRERVLDLHAEKAIAARDLVLAESLAADLVEGSPRRVEFFRRVERERAKQRRSEIGRRVAVLATMGLLIVAGMAGIQLMERDKQVADQERLLEWFERANEHRAEERGLADAFAREFPLPSTLLSETGSTEAAPVDEARAKKLTDELSILRQRRHTLWKQLGGRIDPEPFELLLAEGNVALARGRGAKEGEEAYRFYAQASLSRPDAPEPLLGMGIAAARAGRGTSATAALERAVEATRTARGERTAEHARALALLAQAYQANRESPESYQQYYRKSLAILEPQWADLSLSIARQWRDLGDVRRPLGYASAALELRERDLGAPESGFDARSVAQARLQVSWHLIDQDRFVEAEALALRGLEDLRAAGLGEDPLAASLCAEVGYALGHQERAVEASEYFRESLRVRLATLGEYHADTAEAYFSMGVNLNNMGNVEEGGEMKAKALEIRRRVFGDQHPETLLSMLGVAFNLNLEGRYPEAEKLMREVVAGREAIYGPRHLDTATGWNILANSLLPQGKTEEAEKLFRDCLEVRLPILGEKHTRTAIARKDVARALLAQSRWKEARPFLLRAFASQRANLGDAHALTAECYQLLGWLLVATGEREAGTKLLLRTIDLGRRIEGRDHPHQIEAAEFLVLALTGDPTKPVSEEEARLVLAAGAWLQERYASEEFTAVPFHVVFGDSGRGRLATEVGMARAALALGANNRPLAEAAALRARALANLVPRGEWRDRIVKERVAPLLAELGLEERAMSDVPEPPAELVRASTYGITADAGWIASYENTAAPEPDWGAAFPATAGRGLDGLPLADEEFVAEVDALLREILPAP